MKSSEKCQLSRFKDFLNKSQFLLISLIYLFLFTCIIIIQIDALGLPESHTVVQVAAPLFFICFFLSSTLFPAFFFCLCCHPEPSTPLTYPILTYFIVAFPCLYNPILSWPILSHPILSYPNLSYPILSYPILSYPILSYPILSYFILSYPILCYSILSYPIHSSLCAYISIPSHTTFVLSCCDILSLNCRRGRMRSM